MPVVLDLCLAVPAKYQKNGKINQKDTGGMNF